MLKIPGKIPIQIYPFFLVVVLFISLLNSSFQLVGTLIWAFVICFSLLIHEYGHALTAMAFGQRATIDLVGFGGVTRRFGRPLKPLQEFLIVFNGPLAGFMLCLLSKWVYTQYAQGWPVLAQQTLLISYYANFFWTILNLLPVQPLDGGQLMRIILEGLFGIKGLKTALFLSFLISLGLSIAFFVIGFFLAGAFFLLFTFEGYRAWQSSLLMTQEDDNYALQQFFKSAEKDYAHGHLSYAQQKLNIVRKQAEGGMLYQSASILLARILYIQGHYQEAYAMLKPFKNALTPELQLLYHKLAYQQKLWQEAVEAGNEAFQQEPSSEVALMNAIAHAQLNQARPAVGWLQCAIRNGVTDIKNILKMPEFDPIRNDPLFSNLKS